MVPSNIRYSDSVSSDFGMKAYSSPQKESLAMYPKVKDPAMVSEYSALAKAGGGYVWDEVLEYRVWFHVDDGDDYYYAFEDAETAFECSREKILPKSLWH